MTVMKWMNCVILFLVLVGSLAAFGAYMQPPWVHIVGRGVLRTNAPAEMVREAREAVVGRHRNFVRGPNDVMSDPTSSEASRTWSSGAAKDVATVEVVRNRSQITDKNGYVLSIESIEATDAPSLIFVEFGSMNGPDSIMTEFVDELRKRGVVPR